MFVNYSTRELSSTIVLALVLLSTGCGTTNEEVRLEDAWSRPMPTVSNVAAMYGTLENNTSRTVQLVGASSERCTEMRIHETNIDDGVMSMSDVDEFGLVIDAESSVVMKPNGLHLMCLGTDSPLAEGDRVGVRLEFASGETVEGTVAVEQR